jgi:hypothetical protein
MAKAKDKKDENVEPAPPAPTEDGETTSAYFRRMFRTNPKLLNNGTTPELFERWLKDHPGQKEVPNKVKAILSNLKTHLRKKRRQRRAEKAQVASAAPSSAAPTASGKGVKGLGQLEEQIDDCLALARGMDREGLVKVIGLLRSARNEIVRQAGG